jgi:hypothetical protein
MSRDPLGLDGGDVNLYRYVQNNPLTYTDPSGKQPWFPTPTQRQQIACQNACNEARQNPWMYGIKGNTVGFTLCMPANPAMPGSRFACACVGQVVLNEYSSVKNCILEHETLHITSGDDVCNPNCPAPERPSPPPGWNQAAAECRAAAAEIACLWNAFVKTKNLKEKDRIVFHINREKHYCEVTLGGHLPSGI